MAAENSDREGDAAAVRGVGEVPIPPGGTQALEGGKGGTSDKQRTVMEVGEEKINEEGKGEV